MITRGDRVIDHRAGAAMRQFECRVPTLLGHSGQVAEWQVLAVCRTGRFGVSNGNKQTFVVGHR
jgi:hypothetical protein